MVKNPIIFLILVACVSNGWAATFFQSKGRAMEACQSEMIEEDWACYEYSQVGKTYILPYPSGRKRYFYIGGCPDHSLFNAVTGECEPQGLPPGQCSLSNPTSGNPIQLLTGEKYETIALYGLKNGFSLKLVYSGKIGLWELAIPRLYHSSSSSQKYLSFDSLHRYRFDLQAGGIYKNTSLSQQQKLEQVGEKWLWSVGEKTIEFDALGRVVSISSFGTDEVSFLYHEDNSYPYVIYDQFQDSIRIDLNENKTHVTSLEKDGGVSTQIKYIYSGLISSLLYSDGSQITFKYHDVHEHLLTGVEDGDGVAFKSWSYDESGNAISSEHGGYERTALRYEGLAEDPPFVEEINSLGKATKFYFDVINGYPRVTHVAGQPSPNCAAANKSYDYYDNGTLKSKTDWEGNVTTYLRDDWGREISRTEAAGTPDAHTITTEYHSEFNKPVKITKSGLITEMTYDSAGRLLSTQKTSTTVQ